MTEKPAPFNVVVTGCAGRMGIALMKQVEATNGVTLIGGTEAPGHDAIGKDLGQLIGADQRGIAVTDDPLPLFAKAHAVIDFTAPKATMIHAELAAQARIVHVVGTTGLSNEEDARLDAAARHAVVVQAGNFSLGVNVLTVLTRKLASILDEDFDIEVLEMHHRHKVDAPSGTAIMLAEAAAEGRGVSLDEVSDRARDGITGARNRGDIGLVALRGGGVIGEHTVMFASDNERIELVHKAQDRTLFARGAVLAAKWGVGKMPGRFNMEDVLDLN